MACCLQLIKIKIKTMMDNIKETIDLLRQINQKLSEQLIWTNNRLEEVKNMLSQKEETIEVSISNSIESSDSISPNVSNEEMEQMKGQVKTLQNTIDDLKKQITELSQQKESLIAENSKYKFLLYERIMNEITPIGQVLDTLYKNVQDLYSSDHILYINLQEIEQGYKELVEFYATVLKEQPINAIDRIYTELIEKLDSCSWVNTLLRLSAYAKLDTFKCHSIITNDLILIGKRIVALYSSYNVDIIIPQLLQDDYNNEKYEYDNNHTLWIENLCELNPIDYMGKVYDMVQVGYKISKDLDSIEYHKPIVFYYN